VPAMLPPAQWQPDASGTDASGTGAPDTAASADLAADVRRLFEGANAPVTCYWNHPHPGDPLLDILRALPRARRSARIVYRSEVLGDPPVAAHVAWQRDNGFLVGHSRSLPPGAMAVARSGAVVNTCPAPGGRYTVVRAPGVLRALEALGELLWRRALVVDAPEAHVPSSVERRMLSMLVQGLTDEAVARQLGVSARTVRRMVAHLMDRLGAGSRFEAGVRAVERGWV
jgi:DNA-binding CsgD family transcriptional regulator